MAESEEILQLRRRARRRLTGAAALVLFLVIVPPWLMDLEPKPVSSNLSVEMPRPDTGKQAPPAATGAAPAPSVPPGQGPGPAAPLGPVAPPGPTGAIAPKPEPPAGSDTPPAPPSGLPKISPPAAARVDPVIPAPKPEPALKPAPRVDDAKRAEAALNNETYFIQIGVFANTENARQQAAKASSAGVKVYTEPGKGEKGEPFTRVRAGPFTNRDAAERAREKLKEVGLVPGPVRNR